MLLASQETCRELRDLRGTSRACRNQRPGVLQGLLFLCNSVVLLIGSHCAIDRQPAPAKEGVQSS